MHTASSASCSSRIIYPWLASWLCCDPVTSLSIHGLKSNPSCKSLAPYSYLFCLQCSHLYWLFLLSLFILLSTSLSLFLSLLFSAALSISLYCSLHISLPSSLSLSCTGVAHLHRHNVIHRDIALRNFLVGQDGRLMVSDFGLCRPVSDSADGSYYMDQQNVLPLRWMAPESLRHYRFTKATDGACAICVCAEGVACRACSTLSFHGRVLC